MNTRFSDIYELFLNSIQDYELVQIFGENPDLADDMLETFLLRAISEFNGCQKDIKNVDRASKEFYVELDIDEVNILAKFMVLAWLDRVINDITQMDMSLNDNDFKHFSEEKNLREKSMYADREREKAKQSVTDYLLYRTPFRQWAGGNYELWNF